MVDKAAEEAPKDGGDTESKKAKPKSKKILFIIIGVVVLVLAAGGGAAFFLMHSKKGGAAASAEGGEHGEGGGDAKTHKAAIYQDIKPPFVVDLQDAGRQRYVQISVSLMTRDQKVMDAVVENLPLIRNNLVMVFSAQDINDLKTIDGKEALRQLALEEVQSIMTQEIGKAGIEQVLFTNFVLQ
jgi:flagellar protein FliL